MKIFKYVMFGFLLTVQQSFCVVHEFANEHQFATIRRTISERAILRILQANGITQPRKIPTIGVAFSGGSVRSAFSTIAALQALSDDDLLPVVSYVASTSGGAWGLGAVLAHLEFDRPFGWQRVRAEVASGNSFKFWDTERYPREPFVRMLQEKKRAQQPVGFVDLYGYVLAFRFLGDLFNNPNLKLSNLLQSPVNFPLPIFTTGVDWALPEVGCCRSCSYEHHYEMLEATPLTCTCSNLPVAALTRFFNSEFDGGNVISPKPESTLGFWLGACGSAYGLSLPDFLKGAKDFFAGLFEEGRTEGIMLSDFLSRIAVKKGRFCATEIWNFAYHGGESLIENENFMYLFDAGVLGNVPLYSLLRKPRSCDIVIAIDSSEGCYDGKCKSLIDSVGFALTHGCNVPPIDPRAQQAAPNVKVFEGNAEDPIIIEIYNPSKFLSTKFFYTQEESDTTYEKVYQIVGSPETQRVITKAILRKAMSVQN